MADQELLERLETLSKEELACIIRKALELSDIPYKMNGDNIQLLY